MAEADPFAHQTAADPQNAEGEPAPDYTKERLAKRAGGGSQGKRYHRAKEEPDPDE